MKPIDDAELVTVTGGAGGMFGQLASQFLGSFGSSLGGGLGQMLTSAIGGLFNRGQGGQQAAAGQGGQQLAGGDPGGQAAMMGGQFGGGCPPGGCGRGFGRSPSVDVSVATG